MIHTATTVRMLRALALVLGLALILWSTSLPGLLFTADAADVTSASDTISNSAPSAAANHTIQFTTENGLAAGDTIVLTFPAGFTLGPDGFDFNDMDLATATDEVLASSQGASTWGVATSSTEVTFTAPSGFGVASSSTITIEIGTNATSGATGDTQITNPGTVSSYGIDIGGTMPDSGQVRVAIVEQVTVSATVDTSLTFTISGTSTGVSVNGSPTTTATTTTATSVPFETLSAGTSKVLAQDLSVATNATNGFVVTLEQTGNLQSSTGADIDGFIDGAYTDSPTGWVNPSGTVTDENTFGHWAITSSDDLNGDEFGTDQWVSASTTPRQVFHHNGPADGITSNQGAATIGFQAEITSLQEAGTDYNTTLIYIATPTF